jgi:hypothetical protein
MEAARSGPLTLAAKPRPKGLIPVPGIGRASYARVLRRLPDIRKSHFGVAGDDSIYHSRFEQRRGAASL